MDFVSSLDKVIYPVACDGTARVRNKANFHQTVVLEINSQGLLMIARDALRLSEWLNLSICRFVYAPAWRVRVRNLASGEAPDALASPEIKGTP